MMEKAESPWKQKPWWCQPWSILLTGVTLIAGSWIVFKAVWFTLVVAVPVLAWMGYFLLLWPRLIRQLDLVDPQPRSQEKPIPPRA